MHRHPTESAAVASLIDLGVDRLMYREITPRDLVAMVMRTATIFSLGIFMFATANVFGWVVIHEEVPQKLAIFISTATPDPFIFLLIVNACLLLVGMLIDDIAALRLITPILLPIAMNTYGIDLFSLASGSVWILFWTFERRRSALGCTSLRRCPACADSPSLPHIGSSCWLRRRF